uniref:Uncharacterized protein n=1 Tax=Anguilla anguilla TaxID=7936 RepID=A0A0E9T332_ANGAN
MVLEFIRRSADSGSRNNNKTNRLWFWNSSEGQQILIVTAAAFRPTEPLL